MPARLHWYLLLLLLRCWHVLFTRPASWSVQHRAVLHVSCSTQIYHRYLTLVICPTACDQPQANAWPTGAAGLLQQLTSTASLFGVLLSYVACIRCLFDKDSDLAWQAWSARASRQRCSCVQFENQFQAYARAQHKQQLGACTMQTESGKEECASCDTASASAQTTPQHSHQRITFRCIVCMHFQ
jgi:hypothetical protein